MRVILQGRSARSVATGGGGDQVQIEKTAEALRALGITAECSNALEPPVWGYDLVHLFNIVRPQEVWVQLRNAARHEVPVVLSTVYCDVWEFDRTARPGLGGYVARATNRSVLEAAKAGGRAARTCELHRGIVPLFTNGYTALQQAIIAQVDMLLPNSISEIRRLEHDLGIEIPASRVVPVPNGIDPAVYDPDRLPDDELPERLAPYRGCVLCVARIGRAKNQLALVRAARDLSMPIVIAGRAGPTQQRYWHELQAAAGPNVTLLGEVTETEKWWLYKLARVHVLPSWIETTGLSSLEAAAMRCALVITDKGDTREYFGDMAQYADPADPRSIKLAIERAAAAGPSNALSHKIRDALTWKHAAAATAGAYDQVLSRRGRRGFECEASTESTQAGVLNG
jgi:glycosyltransferase involved in cell wall biosynthesis